MTYSYNILIVINDSLTAKKIQLLFENTSYMYTIVADSSFQLSSLKTHYDFVILDSDISKVTRDKLLEFLNSHCHQTYVLLLSGSHEHLSSRDFPYNYFHDFVIKPFAPSELLARINFHLSKCYSKRIITLGNTTLNSLTVRLISENGSVPLTHYEYKIIRIFFENPNLVFSRTTILDRANTENTISSIRSIDTRICSLRKKLSSIDSDITISAKRNVGYYLTFLNHVDT